MIVPKIFISQDLNSFDKIIFEIFENCHYLYEDKLCLLKKEMADNQKVKIQIGLEEKEVNPFDLFPIYLTEQYLDQKPGLIKKENSEYPSWEFLESKIPKLEIVHDDKGYCLRYPLNEHNNKGDFNFFYISFVSDLEHQIEILKPDKRNEYGEY